MYIFIVSNSKACNLKQARLLKYFIFPTYRRLSLSFQKISTEIMVSGKLVSSLYDKSLQIILVRAIFAKENTGVTKGLKIV